MKRITLSNLICMMSESDHVTIGLETPMIYIRCSSKKWSIELICVNHRMIFYLISIRLINVIILYVVFLLETSKTSHEWMIMF